MQSHNRRLVSGVPGRLHRTIEPHTQIPDGKGHGSLRPGHKDSKGFRNKRKYMTDLDSFGVQSSANIEAMECFSYGGNGVTRTFKKTIVKCE